MSKKDITGKSPTEALFSELLKVDAILRDLPPKTPDKDYFAICELHWSLREKIEAAPVSSPSDLRVKFRTLKLEEGRDPEFTNHGPGSARSLAMTLASHALQLAGAAE